MGKVRTWITQDWDANRGRPESQLVLVSLRLAQWAWHHPKVWWRRPALLFHRWFTSFIVGVDIPPQALIGPGLALYHPSGIVFQSDVVMGAGCVLRHNVTLGARPRGSETTSRSPRIGDEVEFGAGCCVLGAIEVGDGATIGALAVVLSDVPPRTAVVGNPARPLTAKSATP